MTQDYDAIVIGAGISGAAAAYELAADRRVALLEREDRPGYHSTGRSAALYTPNYGNQTVVALVRAARRFFDRPPQGFADHPLLAPRGALYLAGANERAQLETAMSYATPEFPMREIKPAEAIARVPILRAEPIAYAVEEPAVDDMDVAAIHQGFLKGLKARGGETICDAQATALEGGSKGWRVITRIGDFRAPILVNAAGAWADAVARSAGIATIGLVPKRRSAIHVDLPAGFDPRGWPAVDYVGNDHYLKPESGRLMVSPGDATPVEPHDAFPDDMELAELVDWFESVTTLSVERLRHSWAGLRSFVADDSPVVGQAPEAPGFYWLAGQGGYGIMLAPPLARALVGLINQGELPEDLRAAGLSPTNLAADRPGLRTG